MRWGRAAAIGLALAAGAGGACAQLIGADFDVHAAAGGGSSSLDGGPDAPGAGGSAPDAACPTTYCVTTLADRLDHPFGIAVRDGYVYWTVSGTGEVMRGASGGGQVQVLATGQVSPDQIVVDGQYAYWTATDLDGGVFRVRTDGQGGPETLADHQPGPIGIAVDDTNLYWTTVNDTVHWVPLGPPGQAVGTLGAGGFVGIGVLVQDDAGTLYFTQQVIPGYVRAMDKVTGVDTILSQDQENPNGIAVSGDVFFTLLVANGGISRTSVDQDTTTPMATGESSPATIVADEVALYWTDYGAGTIRRLQKGGGTIDTMASGQDSPLGIALDDGYVYWTNHDAKGAVRRVNKK